MNLHDRKSPRLATADYSRPAAYFVTINTKNRKHLFGEIENCKQYLSPLGCIAQEYWKQIPAHFPQITLDAFVIMPDHVHGIIVINKTASQKQTSLSIVIRTYKAAVTTWAKQHGSAPQLWQPRYHDRIIRTGELEKTRTYILNNPTFWTWDREQEDG